MTFRTIQFTISFLLSVNSLLFAQIGKNSWQIGAHGAPLIETGCSCVSGGLLTINADYFLSEKFAIGLVPYYGFTENEGHYGFDLTSMRPWGYSKTSYNSIGTNVDFKYFLMKSGNIKSYLSVFTGIGKTQRKYYDEYQSGEVRKKTMEEMNTYNLGAGLGAQFRLSGSFYLDAKIIYSRIASFEAPNPSYFIYPSIGLIRSF